MIVISNDSFNAAFPVVTVIPLTKRKGKKRRVHPFEVVIPAKLAGNPVGSIVMLHQIRTIDKTRLLEPLGCVADDAVRRAIAVPVTQLPTWGPDLLEDLPRERTGTSNTRSKTLKSRT